MEIESIAEGNEENETDLVQLAENLQQLQANPIEVNFAQQEDLERLPWLNVFQVNNLIQYRARTGPIYSPYELMAIKGFNRATIEKITPYLNFATERPIPTLRPDYIWKYSRHDVIFRVAQTPQQRRGFRPEVENGYLGNPQNYYLRYRGTYRDLLSVGLVGQQDPGEPFGGEFQNTAIDHLSGHVALTNYGNLRSLIVGDYQAEFGQGLVLWTGLAFGKSAETAEIKRYARGFRPFTGSEENRFLRGAAATYRFFDKLDVSAFYSRHRIDANRVLSDSNTIPFVSSLQTTGLHRTLNELDDKDANLLQTSGANLNYRGNGFSVGGTVVNYQLENPLQEGSQLYQKFRFSGKELTNYSVDANYLYRSINLYGELAADDGGKLAGSVGLQSNPADGLFVSLLHRQFDKAYRALYFSPFAENGQYGEAGTYLGVQWQLSRTFLLKTYADLYRFAWLRFRTDAPSQGRDLMAQLEMYFNRRFSGYVRYKNEINGINSDAETMVQKLAQRSRTNLRLHLAYQPAPQWHLASRLEYAFYQQEAQDDRGFVAFQDVRYRFAKIPLQLTGRFAIIETESFDTRIYAYEHDVTYAFSIPPYFGRATRFYLLADYDLTDRLQLQARYALTTFTDRESISSGLQQIEGNKMGEMKVQVRWGF